MARQNLRAAAVIILVVVATAAATASGAHHHRRVRVRTPPEELGMTVHCTEAHGVRAGETCGSVARDARVPLSSFMQLNQNVTCGALFLGQWVCVRGYAIA